MSIAGPARPRTTPDVEVEPVPGLVRSSRPTLRGRVSSGHLVMVVAGLLGVVVSVSVLRDEPAGVRVAVASHDIAAGDVVHATDLTAERVQAPACLLDTLVREDDVRRFRGHVVVAPVAAGELVVRSRLRPRAAPGGLRAMSVPIERARAAGGRLATGDRVDVVFAGQREASIIVADARVLAVDEPGRGGIGEVAQPFTVTLAVDARQSQLLAAAIADGEISLTRTTGARSARGTPPLDLDRVEDAP
jgi:Flp pilus assembly protein CpaB